MAELVQDLPSTDLASVSRTRERSVPTLESVLELCEGRASVIVEIKSHPTDPDFSPQRSISRTVAEMLDSRQGRGKGDRIHAVSSFDWSAVDVFKRASTSLSGKAAYLLDHRAVASRALWRARRAGIKQIHPHYSLMLREPWVPRLATALGLQVACYTVNDALVARALRRLGVDYIISDYPHLDVA